MVTVSIAGTVIVALPDFGLSVAEIAVTVIDWTELVEAGGVNVDGCPRGAGLGRYVLGCVRPGLRRAVESLITVALA